MSVAQILQFEEQYVCRRGMEGVRYELATVS
jgi:hypothetical protein